MVGPSRVTQDVESAASAGSSDDSSDSYNGDDARRYLHEWNAAMDRYSEVTPERGHLEFTLNASQTALATVEGETNTVRAQLATSDARVVGKSFKTTLYLIITLFP